MKISEKIKNIKARVFLHQSIDENEIFSAAINAKHTSNKVSFDEAMSLLTKPLSKQSNILLLELLRVSIDKNDSKLSSRLLKILLRKTNQSFVIQTILNGKNMILRSKLIEEIKQNKKLKVNSKIYLFFMLYKMKKLPRKLLYKELMHDLDKLLLKYQSDTISKLTGNEWDNDYQQDLIQQKFLLRIMRATIFLAKIGYGGKAINFFKRAFDLFKGSNPHDYQKYFKNNNWGWGILRQERRFTDGICDFDNITQYLDTNFKDFFDAPFNQDELEIAPLLTTNALNFATEFAKYSNNTNILKMMFPIHVSQRFIHKNIFGYISLIEKVNQKGFDKSWAKRINDYFFDKQHYSSKVAFLSLSKQIRQKNNIDENKIKDLFTNKVHTDSLRGLFRYSTYEKKIKYYGGCNNTIAFKFVYERSDKKIQDWLEDLFISKKLTNDRREFSQRDFDKKDIVYFKKMFSKEVGEIFEQNIKEKISGLTNQGILTRNVAEELSMNSACYLLNEAEDSGDYARAIKFLYQIKIYSSKKVYYRRTLRKDYVLEQGKKDYMSSKLFRAKMNKFFQAFLELSQKDQRNLLPHNWSNRINDLILPYCNKETFLKYRKQNPYCMFRSQRSYSVVESIRIKKGKQRIESLTNKDFDKDYKKYVSSMIKKDPWGDSITKIVYFLEEAEQRYAKSRFEDKLRADLNQIPCKSERLKTINNIGNGSGMSFGASKKPNTSVSTLLNRMQDEIIDGIMDMSSEELIKEFSDDSIRDLVYQKYDDKLNAFLLEKVPNKVIYQLVEDYSVFDNHAAPHTLKTGLKRSIVKSAIRDACRDLSIDKVHHSESIRLTNEIFSKFGYEDYYFDKFRDWDNECLQIIEPSVAPIYENLANISFKALKSLNFRNKKQAECFSNCLNSVISIKGDLRDVKDFRQRHIKIYHAIEAAAKKLLKKDKISKLTGITFIKVIDDFLYFEQDAAKKYLGTVNLQKFKTLLKNCAMHIIKICKISIKKIYLHDEELNSEIMKNYLQSMETFDAEYERNLERIPLSKEIVQYSRKYNAPYWANSLNIYC